MAQAAQPGRVNGLRQEVSSVQEELAKMRKHIDDLQRGLALENRKRHSAEAALRGDLSSGLQEMSVKISNIATTEASGQQDALVVLDLCKEVEREVREHGVKLQSDMANIANYSLQDMTMVGSASASRETAEVGNGDAAKTLSLQAMTEEQLGAEDFGAEGVSQLDTVEGLEKRMKRARGSAKCPLRTALSLHIAVQKLSSSHSHLLQVVAEQARRMDSFERHISAPSQRKPHFATDEQPGRGGGRRFNDLMRRFGSRSEDKDTTSEKSAVMHHDVADPPPPDPLLPAETVTQHVLAGPSQQALGSNDAAQSKVSAA
jgi:hypothetical protein